MIVGEIKLDITKGDNVCDTCPAANFKIDAAMAERFGTTPVEYPAAIYALTIGAGYRQPSYLCPDCLGRLRDVLGVRVFSGNAPCAREGNV